MKASNDDAEGENPQINIDPENIATVYKDLGQYPSMSNAFIGPEVYSCRGAKYCNISTDWSQQDLERQEQVKFRRQYTVFYNGRTVDGIAPTGNCVETKGELLSKDCPKGGLKAVVRRTGFKGNVKDLLEIWRGHRKVKNVNLTALNKHGPVYADHTFGCLEWSQSGNHILYVAEKKRPNAESYFKAKPSELSDSPEHDDQTSVPSDQVRMGDQFVFQDDWGEGLINKSVPALCILDIKKNHISVLEGVPDQISPGQALWAPEDKGVLFVGWCHEPFRLGLTFFNNRRSALYHLKLSSSTCELLSLETEAVCSPRLSPDRQRLIYLAAKVSGPHWNCSKLCMYDWHLKTNSTVLDVVRRSKADFSGIYSTSLTSHCWAMDSRRVLINTPHRSRKVIIVVNTETGTVISITPGSESWTLLTLQDDLIVASCSTPNCPQFLKIGFLQPVGKEADMLWISVEEPEPISDIEWKTLTFHPPPESDSPKYSDLEFESILLSPQHANGRDAFPLIVYPHGGPHSVFDGTWQVAPAVLCHLGFAVLMVNYRGSTGFGQDSIESLMARVGQQDVADVQYAVEQVLKSEPVDPKRMALYGGSHGGYICCHMIGQYPDTYKACAVRNPLINIACMIGSLDAPDWRYVEVGFKYAFDQVPTKEALAAMVTCSPDTYAPRVKTPLLVLLGEKDRRLSPHHGMNYYRVLKARGVPVRVLWYPDNHSLSGVEAQADGFVNSAAWIARYVTS